MRTFKVPAFTAITLGWDDYDHHIKVVGKGRTGDGDFVLLQDGSADGKEFIGNQYDFGIDNCK